MTKHELEFCLSIVMDKKTWGIPYLQLLYFFHIVEGYIKFSLELSQDILIRKEIKRPR